MMPPTSLPADLAASDLPAGSSSLRFRSTCRACGGTSLARFLDLGSQPLANAFPRSPAEFSSEPRFPLEVYLCQRCGLVQLLHVVDPELLFRDYIYVTGTSDTIAAHNVEYARTVTELLQLRPDDLVIEVASNDGSLLSAFAPHGVRTLGIEPARNIAALARRRGIDTVDEFFSSDMARRQRDRVGAARAVIGNNVLAHVDDTVDFLRGMALLLQPGGLAIVEVPYLGEMVERLEYDTIYHEHLCYFSLSALLHVVDAAGLSVQRVDRVPVHGGSLRVYAGLASEHPRHADDVVQFAAGEQRDGLTSLRRFEEFARAVEANRAALVALLEGLRDQGKSVAAYGAPAKGNTLLNYCRIGTKLLQCTFDRSPHKTGRFTPGMHLPVLDATAIGQVQPDFLLLLAWNFADEIMRQQSAFRAGGGRFILPIPKPTIV